MTLGSILTHELRLDEAACKHSGLDSNLVRRCLEKDRRRRLADIADARLETDDALAALKRRNRSETSGQPAS